MLFKVNVPINLIFTSNSMIEKDSKYFNELNVWNNVPIINFEPLMSYAEYIVKGNGNLMSYLEFEAKRYGLSDSEREILKKKMKKRKSLKYIPRISREVPVVDGYKNDKLFVKSGELVCAIAKIKQKNWISVNMPNSVAEIWKSRSTKNLDQVLITTGRTSFYTPIYHDKYKACKYSREGVRRLDMMRKFLGPIHDRLSVLDIGCNTGFYPFNFARQGFEVHGIDIDREHLAIAEALKQTYSLPVSFREVSLRDFKSERPFDLVLAMSVIWHMLGWGKYAPTITEEELGARLDKFVGKYLFWESGEKKEEEIRLIKEVSKLKNYKKLGVTSATGIKDRDFGVFSEQHL